MGGILRNWRVLGAALIAITVMGGSYLLVRSIDMPALAQASAETALLQSIATKDSTGDGLPDWQKALYGIPLDATTTDYFNLGMTDGEAVAKGLIVPKAIATDPSTATSTDQGTLTESFGKAFFALYLSAKQANGGANLTPDQTNALANEALNQFIENFAPAADSKTAIDLKSSGNGHAALIVFADAAERVFNRYQSQTPVNEIKIVQDVLQNSDPSALTALTSVATIYREYAAGLAALTVPAELTDAELSLVNAFFQRASIYEDIAKAQVDPLMAIVALQQLSQNETAWAKAFADIGTVYTNEGISVPAGTSGADFIDLAVMMSSKKP